MIPEIEFDFMKKYINYGVPLIGENRELVGHDIDKDPDRIEFGLWMERVPQPLKLAAVRAVKTIFEKKYMRKPFTQDNRIRMLIEMSEYMKSQTQLGIVR